MYENKRTSVLKSIGKRYSIPYYNILDRNQLIFAIEKFEEKNLKKQKFENKIPNDNVKGLSLISLRNKWINDIHYYEKQNGGEAPLYIEECYEELDEINKELPFNKRFHDIKNI